MAQGQDEWLFSLTGHPERPLRPDQRLVAAEAASRHLAVAIAALGAGATLGTVQPPTSPHRITWTTSENSLRFRHWDANGRSMPTV